MADHVWVGAALVGLSGRQAALADLRGAIKVPQTDKVKILEVYCDTCRRPWDDVADQPCHAAADNEHLRGGPVGQRKPRTHTHDCMAFGCPGTGIPESTIARVAAAAAMA